MKSHFMNVFSAVKNALNEHKVLSLIMISTMTIVVLSGTITADNQRLVRLYVDGESKTYQTTALTVGEFLDQRDVDLADHDAVEPTPDTEISQNGQVYNVNVYRGRPVTVVDGDFRQTVTTAAQSPRAIAEQVGLEVRDEDRLELTRITDIVREGVLGLKVTVTRATEYQLQLFGETSAVYSHETTVGGVLGTVGVQVEPGDTLSPAAEAALNPGDLIVLSTIRTEKQTVREDVAFPVRRINDDQMSVGEKRIETPGVLGEADVVYEITLTDGAETARQEVSRVTLKEPSEQVEVVGTKPVPVSSQALRCGPVEGEKQAWLEAAGIAQGDWEYANFIICKESSWNPGARNPSSGAGGLPQALPYSKTGCAWGDAICQLRWADGYAKGRYGSWANAYAEWNRKNWW